jgi:acyl carrier protein
MKNHQEKIDFIRSAIAELKHVSSNQIHINLTDNLSKFNLDSLDIVELQMMYEDKTGKQTENPTKAVKTVQDLIDVMT